MKKNNKPKKLKYKFDKKKHYHSLGGIPLYGTTTALSVISKPYLIPWASKMAVEHIRSNWKLKKTYTKAERDAILEEAKHAHDRAKKAGGSTGTDLHEIVEKWIKNDYPQDYNPEEYCKDDEQLVKMFKAFTDWTKDNDVKFVMSELNVYSETHWFGGILDFVCEIKGKRYVGDLKTSSGIYPEHFLQMGAYDVCLQEMGHPPADAYIVVNVQKNGKLRVMELEDSDKYRRGFIHALELYKILKTMTWNANY